MATKIIMHFLEDGRNHRFCDTQLKHRVVKLRFPIEMIHTRQYTISDDILFTITFEFDKIFSREMGRRHTLSLEFVYMLPIRISLLLVSDLSKFHITRFVSNQTYNFWLDR